MAELKITDLVDAKAIEDLKALSAELSAVRGEFEATARDLVKGLKIKVEVVGDIEKLNSVIAAGSQRAADATNRLNSAIEKQNQIVAQTTNTISRELAEIEKENAKKREKLQVDKDAHALAQQTLGSLNENIKLLARQKQELDALKKAQKDGSISLEEYLAREREIKIAMQELNGVINNQQKLANSAEGSYQNLSLQLEILKKAYKGLTDEEKKSDAGKKMAAEIQNLDAALKDSAADMGEFQRNVGNYAIANGNAKTQLKELVQELATLTLAYRAMSDEERASSEGQELQKKIQESTQKAADLKDAIADVNREIKETADDTKNLNAITEGINVLISGFGAATGAAHLLGLSEKDLVEVQTKLQSILVISNGLTKMQNALQKESALMAGVTAIQTKAAAAAKALETKETVGATIAQTAFNIVAKANPYVLLATALITVVGALAAFAIGTSKATKEQEAFNKAQAEGVKAYAKAKIEIDAARASVENFNGTKEQEKQLVESLNSRYGTAVGKYKSLKEWKDALAKNSENYAKMLLMEAQAQAILNDYVEAYGKKREAEQKQKEYLAKGFWGKFWDNITHLRTGDKNGYADEIKEQEDAVSSLEGEYKKLMNTLNEFKMENSLAEYAPGNDTEKDKKSSTKDKKDAVAEEISRRKLINSAALSVAKQGTAEWLMLKKEANEIAYEEDLHNSKLTGEKRAQYDALLQERLKLQNEAARKEVKDYIEKSDKELNDNLTKLQEEYTERMEKEWAAREVMADQTYQREENALRKQLANNEITEKEYNEKSAQLAEQYAIKKAKATIDHLNEIKDSSLFTEEERRKMEEELAQATIDYEKAMADATINQNRRKQESDKEMHERRMKNTESYLNAANNMVGAVSDLTSQIFDTRMADIDKEKEALDKKYDEDVARIEAAQEAGVISEEEANQRKVASEEAKAAKEEEIEKRKAELKKKQAIADKAAAVIQATISTALAVLSALQTQPFLPLGPAMAAVAGAMGAVQIATILAQPTPQYAEGTDYHKGGPAIVGDGGRAELVTYGGKAYITPDTPTLVNLPRGAKVIPDAYGTYGLNPFDGTMSSTSNVVVNPTNTRGIEQRVDETNRLMKISMRQERRLAANSRYNQYKSSRV